jgi:hypothetical protein
MAGVVVDTLKLARRLGGRLPGETGGRHRRGIAEAMGETVVTREYLDLRLAQLKVELLTWMFGALAAQAGIIVALLKLLP